MRSCGRSRNATGERGDTLIEVLVSVAIIGIMVVGLFPAVANSLASAHRVRNHAQIAEVMSTAVQTIHKAAWRTNCNYAPDFTAALTSVTITPKPVITQDANGVAKWDGNAFVGTTLLDGCPATSAPAALQIIRLRIRVAGSTGSSSQWVEVVKRK
jgi:prepilin-type N-terminal cleavage/methylation domain-containing protein